MTVLGLNHVSGLLGFRIPDNYSLFYIVADLWLERQTLIQGISRPNSFILGMEPNALVKLRVLKLDKFIKLNTELSAAKGYDCPGSHSALMKLNLIIFTQVEHQLSHADCYWWWTVGRESELLVAPAKFAAN